MIEPLTPEQLKAAAFEGGSALRSFNYQDLAHLCAGIDYQFGPKGVLIAGAVSTGKGEPKYPFDPRNPYFRLPDFTGNWLNGILSAKRKGLLSRLDIGVGGFLELALQPRCLFHLRRHEAAEQEIGDRGQE